MMNKEQKAKLKAIEAVGEKLAKELKLEEKIFQHQGDKVGKKIPSIKSGFPSLDHYVLGCGGFPRGRIIEIFGEESSGKTSFTCHLIGQCQKAGGMAAFIDAEHALDPTFATKLGVDMDALLVSQPDYGEQALEIVDALVEDGTVDLIVVDSVSGLVPKAELEGDMGDSHMGLQARMMSQAMRKLVGKISKKKVTVIFINQIREKVGLVFGDPTVTSGGKALKFAASVRFQVRRLAKSANGEIKEGETVIGHRMNVKNKKNKVGPPFRETQLALYYDSGYDTREDVINHALDIGVLQGNAWITFTSDKLGEKFRKPDLDEARVKAEIEKYYELNDLKTTTEASNEETNSEDQA